MRTAFIVVTTLTGVFVAWGYPFIAILRGKQTSSIVRIGWGLVFLYFLTLCLLLPMLVNVFDKKFAEEMLESWVPELPSVVAAALMGWLPPLMSVAIGTAVKSLLDRFWPALANRIQCTDGKDEGPSDTTTRKES